MISGEEPGDLIDSDSCFPHIISDFLGSFDSFDASGLPSVKFLLGFKELVESVLKVLEKSVQSFRTVVLLVTVINASGDDVLVIDLNHGVQFGGDTVYVTVNHDLGSGMCLFLFKGSDLDEDLRGFSQVREYLGELGVDIQSSLLCLDWPLRTVPITVEPDTLRPRMQVCKNTFKALTTIQSCFHFVCLVGHSGCNRRHDERRVLG